MSQRMRQGVMVGVLLNCFMSIARESTRAELRMPASGVTHERDLHHKGYDPNAFHG